MLLKLSVVKRDKNVVRFKIAEQSVRGDAADAKIGGWTFQSEWNPQIFKETFFLRGSDNTQDNLELKLAPKRFASLQKAVAKYNRLSKSANLVVAGLNVVVHGNGDIVAGCTRIVSADVLKILKVRASVLKK